MFVPPPIGRYIGMPPQDVQAPQGHATDDAAVVDHGLHSPPVAGHGKERRRRRKHEVNDDAAGSGVVVAAALSSGIDAAAAVGRATDGARHHRQPRPPASGRTRTEACSSKYDDDASVRAERGSFRAVVQYSAFAPAATERPVVLIRSRHKHRAANTYSTAGGGDSYYASDDHFAASPRPHSKPAKTHAAHHSAASASAAATADGFPARASTGGHERYDSPSVAARPNGFVNGGIKHRHRQAANYANDYAAASISSSRLVIREPAIPPPPPHHRPTKPHKDHGAPKSSAPAPPPPQEPSEDELLRVGLEVAAKMDMATLHSMVKEYVVRRNQEVEPVEEERPPFWRPLTDDEVDADLRAAAARRAAASSGKRRRH